MVYNSHSWDGTKQINTKTPFIFVPQIWGIDNQTTTLFLSALADNFTSVEMLPDLPILTYNEPNQPGQALCSPSDAAIHWKTHLEPLRKINGGNWTLASPAVTSAADGKTWLNEFLGNCSGCGWDFGAIHWYNVDPEAFVEYVEDFHDSFGKKSELKDWHSHCFFFLIERSTNGYVNHSDLWVTGENNSSSNPPFFPSTNIC